MAILLTPRRRNISIDESAAPIINYARSVLRSRIFLGRYLESRLVDDVIGYRDIVVMSPAEVELIKDVIEVGKKIVLLNKYRWIGITDTDSLNLKPSSICLWTEIDQQPLGLFWFQITDIEFRIEEVLIQVSCIRHITEAFLEAEPILTGKKKLADADAPLSDSNVFVETVGETFTEVKEFLISNLNFRGIKQFFSIFIALIVAVVFGSVDFIKFLGNFILSFMRELSNFTKNSTPILLGAFECFSKIVGGFYILLAMIFKPAPKPMTYHESRQPYQRQIEYPDQRDGFNTKWLD